MSDFVERFDAGTEGLTFLSSGACSSCKTCQSTFGLTRRQLAAAIQDGTLADEGSFSWSACDTCGESLGGNRYDAHAIADVKPGKAGERASGTVIHLNICEDCLFYTANGTLPDERD